MKFNKFKPIWVRVSHKANHFFFFFFLNPNLYSARVQLGTEAVTLLQAYYDYEEKVKAAASVSWPWAEKEIAGLGGRIGSLAASQTSDSV